MPLPWSSSRQREASLALPEAGADPEVLLVEAVPTLLPEGTSPETPSLVAPPQSLGLGGLLPPSAQAPVVSLGDLSAGLPPQYGAYDFTAYHAVDMSGLARFTEARKLGLAQIGVPPPCIAFMAEAGVSMDNVADLPWETLEGLVCEVSGVGRVQLALLQALHARLQAELEARSGRSSRSGSGRAHTRARSREHGRRCSQRDVGQHQRQQQQQQPQPLNPPQASWLDLEICHPGEPEEPPRRGGAAQRTLSALGSVVACPPACGCARPGVAPG